MKLLALCLALAAATAHADPRIGSWFTSNSGKYARIYTTSGAETAGTFVTTWSRGQGAQSLPTYADVSEVSYSTDWVYIRTTGLASHVMGPWYLDSNKTQLFPNYPANTATIYRIPRNPTVPASKTLTSNGAIGYFVNGVAFFDNRDAFSYSNSHAADATPMTNFSGDGIWNRNAYVNESTTFDAALAHQAGKQYHYHVQPIALRYQLGDHVTYNATTNRYSESTAAVSAHSPIIAWAADGYPVYGPYGYSTATDATSGVRRIVSGYVLRNGASGTTNLNTAGRHTLPAWAASAQNRSATLTSTQYGPNVSTTYTLGHYLEDYDYLGDLGFVQGGGSFDLDRYNGRTCVTPEFPAGTYAYFSTLDSSNAPAFPYNIGRQFYGSPAGGTVTSVTETVTINFSGGPNSTLRATSFTRDAGTGAANVTWSSVDGGTYKVQQCADLASWADLQTGIASGGASSSFSESAASQGGATQRFYRVTRTALASYDSTGFDTSTGSAAPASSTSTASSTTLTTTAARSIASARKFATLRKR
ncbi:MAG TPA: YHYH protein [Chthoniobacteraceae bacterium]|nr:YHYH protein [Chthoniobacteraceae bacterium]